MAAAADGDFPSSILSEGYQVAARRTIGGTAGQRPAFRRAFKAEQRASADG